MRREAHSGRRAGEDLRAFIDILPDWGQLSEGLDSVVLARGDSGLYGYYVPGVIAICAWPRELVQHMSFRQLEREQPILMHLGVPLERRQHDVLCHFDEQTVRGFQLMDVFLHELGHHRDRMTTHRRWSCAGGEPFAERYARELSELVWSRYREAFNHPERA